MEQTTILTGGIAALLDEYKRAINDLIEVVKPLQNQQLVKMVDANAEDEDCKSIQTILTHVIASGLVYTIEIEKHNGFIKSYPEKLLLNSTNEYISELNQMFEYCKAFFARHPIINISEHDNSKKIKVRWGQTYDIEQLLEHAILHILRHRRQIERFAKNRQGNNNNNYEKNS